MAESELMKQVPTIAGHTVAVSKIIQIPPEPICLTIDNKNIDVPIPSSYIGKYLFFEAKIAKNNMFTNL